MNIKLHLIVVSVILFFFVFLCCSKEQKDTVNKDTIKTNLQSEIKTDLAPEKKILTFEEFTDVFRNDAYSESGFMKHCESSVNGNNPLQAYRMYKQYLKSKPII